MTNYLHYQGLSEIAPKWAKRLEKQRLPFPLSFTWLHWYYEIREPSKCIAGEAHGFSPFYTKTCKECDRFSVKFLYSFATHSYSNVQKKKDLFVEYWNEFHLANDDFAMKMS